MASKVRYAIIGFGGIAQQRIAPEGFACDTKRFKPHETCELVCVTSRSASHKPEVEALGLKWYNTQEEIFSDPNIDAVFIATNNATHCPIAKAALNAGKHVILEKPMTVTVAEAEEIIALAEQKNLSVAINHMMMYNGYTVKAAEIVKSGALGTVNDAVFHMEFNLALNPKTSQEWRCASAADKGGPIGDLASHCFYTLEYVMGSEIVELQACYYPKVSKVACEDGAWIKVRLANGISASVRVSFVDERGCFAATVQDMGYSVFGDKAVLRSYTTLFQMSGHSDEPYKVRLELDDFQKATQVEPAEIRNIYAAVVLRHADAVRSGKRLDGRDGLHNMKLCEAAHESASNGGKPVKI